MHNSPQPAATRRKKDLNLTLAPHGKTRFEELAENEPYY